jgi:helicase
MPPVKIVAERELIPTSQFPLGKFPFQEFNPVQSRVLEYYNLDQNVVIASSTASGKTICAELIISHCVRVVKKKAIFLVPLRSLAQEKYDEWTDADHHFFDLKISVCTGDYRVTKDRLTELNNADIVIMSSEMLNHQSKNLKSNKFLLNVGVLAVDECHGLTAISRGSHLESSIMKFTEINPKARLVLLSATLPNVAEIAEWSSYSLNNKLTVLIKSNYRPCKLNLHFEKYSKVSDYKQNEINKVDLALEIIEYYKEDKFIVFAHTKGTGRMMKETLDGAGIPSEFHNADLVKEKRLAIEKSFKGKDGIRVIVATSTLAAGINMPARRVIILGVKRGVSDVDVLDIAQEAGRAGRPRFDTVGDAYILLPDNEEEFLYHKRMINNLPPVTSRMLDNHFGKYKTLAFHILSEIVQGNIKTIDCVRDWYNRSLASFQSKELTGEIIKDTVELLKKIGAIKIENNELIAVGLGKVANMFYLSPFDVFDYRNNFSELFNSKTEFNDIALAYALGNIDSNKTQVVSKKEKEQYSLYLKKLQDTYPGAIFSDGVIKASFCYFNCLKGIYGEIFSGYQRQLINDFNRISSMLELLDSMSGRWGRKKFFNNLGIRISYGVGENLVELCKIPHVGKVRAEKLYRLGVKDLCDFSKIDNKLIKSTIGVGEEKFSEIINFIKRKI